MENGHDDSPRVGKVLATSELCDELRRESRRFLNDLEEMIAECHEDTPIIESTYDNCVSA